MYLFAEASGSNTLGAIIFIGILALGFRKMLQTLKGNDAVRGAAKKGALSLLGRLFKK